MSSYRIVAVEIPGHPVRQLVRTDGTPLGTPRATAAPEALAVADDSTSAPLLSGLSWWVPRAPTTRRRQPPRRPVPLEDETGVPTGAALAARRLVLGVGQRELAARVGLSRGLMCEIEHGRRVTVSVRRAMDAALAELETVAGAQAGAGRAGMMRELPPRTYPAGAKSPLRFGTAHPAKMAPLLCRDLFLRYTLPGQVVLDPFFGRGTSLVGCTLGRHVIGVELEPPFVEYARANYEYLRAHLLPGMNLGEAVIYQGDSRRLPLPSAADACLTSPPYADSVQPRDRIGALQRAISEGRASPAVVARFGHVRAGDEAEAALLATDGYGISAAQIGNLPHVALTSPPFGEMNADHAGGAVGKMRPAKDGNGFENPGDTRLNWCYSEETPGQIGNLKYGRLQHAPDAVVSSPPYGELADRNRSQEPYAQAHPEREREYGGAANRHVDGYGETPGQIGALPHAALTSPPYAGSHLEAANDVQHGVPFRSWSERKQDQGYGGEDARNRDPETYASAVAQVYRECFRVIRPGGILVLVVGPYVRDGQLVDLAADTITLCVAAGWTPVERWQHQKASISFWRRLHARQRPNVPVVTWEDVLVFCKGKQPAWDFNELPPTRYPPVVVRDEQVISEVPEAMRSLPLFEGES